MTPQAKSSLPKTTVEKAARELGGPREPGGRTVPAFGGVAADRPLERMEIERREPDAHDVEIEIEYCGLCHSDVHSVRGEWGEVRYPYVPGHEIVGRVRRVGAEVSGFTEGERVGVGCLVDSCRECESCREGLQQYCTGSELGGGVPTYGAEDYRHGGEQTQGGYSTSVVVNEGYVLRIPEGMDPASAAPLLCAGITTYSPLRHAGVGTGTRVGVVGLGGLGHMAVKIAKAMGAEVTVFSRSDGKREAARELGADAYVNSSDEQAMKGARRSLDVVIDTVAAPHSLDGYLAALARDGRLTQVGLPSEPMPPVNPAHLIMRRVSYGGSLIGGLPETQEMLDFCAEHGIAADIETVEADGVNAAYDRMVAGDVKYRFVLDVASLRR
ncbi:NAD(P)-dependent alcohol dehydrogenase [Arthrobacter sp. UM1]|uniref:NAD(P)-dependent alcohol dehydrogenase n=1 Tax=Arthrobacter sp. UM1 TaxID=2766776 RepID=UPI0039AF5158|nr:NAD(P)-dependent alcohol dehydrogenase [Arthrobacter sp. UM1]